MAKIHLEQNLTVHSASWAKRTHRPCEISRAGHCNGKDVRIIRLATKRNVFTGDICYACEGCRALYNGGFKYPVVTVLHFEDHGQDFLRWFLDSTGKVIMSSPFQTSVWKGVQVEAHTILEDGDIVYIKSKHIGRTTLNYRVEKVERFKDGKEVSHG